MATMIPDNVEIFSTPGENDSVAISTIHSAKGLDYAHLFLLGLDTFDEERLAAEHIERLTYVGVTRARYQLFIPYIRKTPLIEKLLGLI
jgi:superfamily I DNA/RNA helicase